jgi:hypothetical protein
MTQYREHEPYHERRLEQQTLDTLLRIEEILADLRDAGANGPPAAFKPAADIVSQQRAGTMEEGDVSGLTGPRRGKRK